MPKQESVEVFPVISLVVVFVAVTLVLVVAGFALPGPAEPEPTATLLPTWTATVPPTEAPVTPTTEPVAVAAALDPAQVQAGAQIYQVSCSACHGFNARGISGLGKTLIGSEYVNNLTDDELHDFLLVGRPVNDPLNTTGVAMPAKGGNPNLTDADLYNVVAYIRSLNTTDVVSAPTAAPTDSGPRPTATPWSPPSLGGGSAAEVVEPTSAPTETAEATEEVAEATEEAAGVEVALLPEQPASSGADLYQRYCAACHGPGGEGVEFFGPALSDSTLLQDRNGIGLLELLSRALPPANPEDGFQHPYRGGYPPLTDLQLLDIIGYLYELIGAE